MAAYVPPKSELKKLAASYECHHSTLGRLAARGVDVTDPQAVALALAKQQCTSPAMLAASMELAAIRGIQPDPAERAESIH